jgi:very-short-patch-repair endonuclease
MFFSPVVSSGIKDTALSFLNSNPNLFNVAITRARASLVVVGDKAMASQCGVGYLSRFASYSDNMNIESESTFEGYKNPGEDYPIVADPSKVSDWEIYFYKVLFLKGIKTIPQYPVEKYILDFAIIIGDKKLNIEVDGERYHKNWDGELCRRDQIRNQRMMELGWDVMRFWVYQIRDDLEFCVNKINTWIKKNEGEVQSSIKTEVNNATHKEVLRPTIKNSDNQKKIDDALSNGLIF